MSATDGFEPDDDPLPLFLVDKPEEQGIGEHRRIAVFSSRTLKASALVAAATFIGVPILSAGNPVLLLAALTASQADKPSLQPATGESTPTIQSAYIAETLPATANGGPTRDEIAAAFTSAHQSQLEQENREHEALFREFQAWAADKDAQAEVEIEQSVQNAPVAVVRDAPAPLRPSKKNLRRVRSARAEIRSVRHHGKQVRREQNRPAQDSRAQDQTVQNAQAPWLLQIFGWRD
jgi:hypothetical protein